ncbi:MAG: hypothetical protein ACYC55_00325 [Candidatus Geothermincolia bacterium]
MRILMQTLDGKLVADLQESHFQGLTTQTEDPLGFTICEFEVAQRIDLPSGYESLVPARIDEGAQVVFDGFVAPGYPHAHWGKDSQGFGFALLGWATQFSMLETRGLYINAGAKASTFITDWVHGNPGAYGKGDAYLQNSIGDVQTTDYVFDSPKYWEHATWRQILEDLNKPNDWSWGIYEDRELFFRPRTDTVDYYIWLEDSEGELDSGSADIVDFVMAAYRPSFGGATSATWYPDAGWTPPADRVGIRKWIDGTGNLGGDQVAAELAAYYDYYSEPHIAGPLTVTAITNRLGVPVPLWSVRAGTRACLMGYRYWEQLDSFRIKNTTYNHDSGQLTLEREVGTPRLETMLARVGQ